MIMKHSSLSYPYMAQQGKRLMDTVENDNEAFITQLTVNGTTRYESDEYC